MSLFAGRRARLLEIADEEYAEEPSVDTYTYNDYYDDTHLETVHSAAQQCVVSRFYNLHILMCFMAIMQLDWHLTAAQLWTWTVHQPRNI